MRNFRLLLWTVIVCLPDLAGTQSVGSSWERGVPSFARYTTEQGLADNWVHIAMQDRKGFLWFGTEGGLSRFDGQNFLNFYEQAPPAEGLSKNSVKDICEDPDGTFWIAVLDGGLNHFNPATGKFEHWKSDPTLTSQFGTLLSLTSICQDGDLLWLGSYHHGLGCFDKKKRRFTGWFTIRQDSLMSNTFQYNTVNHVIPDRRNPHKLWVAVSGRGLAHFDKRTYTFDIVEIKDKAGRPGPASMKLLQDAGGKVWIATWSAGVASFDPATKKMDYFPYDIPSWEIGDSKRNVVLAILEKNDSELWVATEDNGFGILDKKTGQYRFFQNPLSGESPELDRNSEGLFIDRAKRLWVLGVKGGVRAFNLAHQSFRYISLAAACKGPAEQAEVTAFAFNPWQNTFFVATENAGIFEWSETNGTLRQMAKPISGGIFPYFQVLRCDREGNIWAGAAKSLSGGASLYLLPQGHEFFKPVKLFFQDEGGKMKTLGETINDIFMDAKGQVWIATSYDGVYKIKPDTRQAWCFSDERGFRPGTTAFKKWWAYIKIKEDKRGHLWFALKSGGLIDFDPNTAQFTLYDTFNGLVYDNLRSMEIALDGSIWAGTPNGIEVFTPNYQPLSLKVFNEKNGLPGTYVSGIEQDDSGNIWLATNKGLAVFRHATDKFEVFSTAEGLKNPYLKDKGLAAIPGLGLLVGQPNGFCLLYPSPDKMTEEASPEVVLTDFKVFYQSKYFEKNIRNAQEVVLGPSENVFAFEFAVPSSLDANLVSYQFQLSGFDEKWYSATDRRSVTYTGLPPGSYVFRVRAQMPGGPTGETAISIRILPKWWQSWWFVALIVVAFLLAGWLILHYRTAQVRHEEQMKAAFYRQLSEKEMTALRSQMNPHFIFNCLNSINNFVVRNNSEQAANYITKFSRLIRLVLDNSRSQKVPLKKDLEALKLYMELEAMRFNDKFRYEVWVDDEVDEQFVQVPPLLIQPYVENAIWHGLMHKSEGGSVIVDVRQFTEKLLIVEITDDGVGRERAALLESKSALTHKSHGTSITTERLRMLNSNKHDEGKVTFLDLIDAEGQPCGTKVVLEIPV